MSRLGGLVRLDATRARLALAVLAGLAAVFLAGTLGAPWLASRWPLGGSILRLLYRPLCHQIPQRCLDLGAGPLAVCARCLGLYLGGFAGLSAALVTRRAWRPTATALLIVAAPSVLDLALGLAGLPSLPNVPRLLIALPLGVSLGSALACAAGDVFTPPSPATNSPSPNPVE